MSIRQLSEIEDLTSMFNGKTPFPKDFKEAIDLNILETHSAIRLDTLNPYNVALLSQGVAYMTKLIPGWKKRAKPLEDKSLILALLRTIVNQSEHIGKINNQSPVEWYYGLCMLIKFQMEFLKTKTELNPSDNFGSDPILTPDERAHFELYEDKVLSVWSKMLDVTPEQQTLLQHKKLNLKEETDAMQYLVGVSDFAEILNDNGYLTPAQTNQNNFLQHNLRCSIERSANSIAPIFILDNSQVKNFIEHKNLKIIVDALVPDYIQTAFNTSLLIYGDDPYLRKQSLRAYLTTPAIETSTPNIEF